MTSRVQRGVVSFVRRSTRMNPSQQRAWDRYASQYVVPVTTGERYTSLSPDASVDWQQVFGREAPMVVEIGSGAGESLVAMAANRPDHNVVAFEVFTPAVASTLTRIANQGVTNVRLVVVDGTEGLAGLFADASLAELWTFFADPWHKTRHHKRRLVNPQFADLAVAKLAPGGYWRLATDWDDYANWQRTILDAHPGLRNVHGGWAPRLAERPVTKYEQRGLDAGRTIHDLTYQRLD